jgi:NAD(P)H-hydrate epimerase
MESITVKEMRELEEKAFARGNTILELMERAGKECAHLIESKLGTGKTIVIFCGSGNNGGDGLVCARYLSKNNDVRLILPIEPKTEAAKENLRKAQEAGIEIVDSIGQADIVVDALLGIGTRGPLRGVIKDACRLINSSKTYKISIDVPTGMDAETGECDADAVKPDVTICIHAPKTGQAGELWIADIGLSG